MSCVAVGGFEVSFNVGQIKVYKKIKGEQRALKQIKLAKASSVIKFYPCIYVTSGWQGDERILLKDSITYVDTYNTMNSRANMYII